MERKKIIAGNWKMNKTLQEAKQLVNALLSECKQDEKVTKILFPSFPFLTEIKNLLNDRTDFFIGAQNCHTHESGAFTGEVSAQALASVGMSHVLVGHSERRQYFNETSTQLKEKINAAFKHQLIPVYCFGELLSDRKENKHFELVASQLKEVIAHLSPAEMSKLILAYEPVWAIGTGETASPQQAEEMHDYIRKIVKEMHGAAIAEGISILYGGSCNAANAAELFSCANVDGGLIGGASLKAPDFLAIIEASMSMCAK